MWVGVWQRIGLSVGGDISEKIDNPSVTSVTTSVAKLLTIENPNSEGFDNLPFAEIEAAAITQIFPNHKRIAGENATKTQVIAALSENYDIFHFTGHGNYNSDRALDDTIAICFAAAQRSRRYWTLPQWINRYSHIQPTTHA